MKVTMLIADPGAVGVYRCSAPAEEARKLGIEINVVEDVPGEALMNPETYMIEVKEIHDDADVFVIQRPLNNMWPSFVDVAHRQGSAVVVDIDDDLDTVHKKNMAHDEIYKNTHIGVKWFHETVKKADLVTTSTLALTKYAKDKSVILRNYMPMEIFETPLGAQEPSLGWTGAVATHPNDLPETKGVIQGLMDEYNVPFTVVGEHQLVRGQLGLRDDARLKTTGWVDIDKYYFATAQAISVGIVPLELSPFNQAKSALKGMEYAALGIPFVASPTAEYVRLEAYGVGKTAKSPSEWKRGLSRLLDDPDKANMVGKRYRDIIMNEFTYREHASEWVTAWEKALTNFRG